MRSLSLYCYYFFFLTNSYRILRWGVTFTLWFPRRIVWLTVVVILAELNRAPYDMTEGESELVSGFNTEYYRIRFAFIFLSEYGFMVFFCLLVNTIFIPLIRVTVLMILIILWVRSAFPRIRYDYLILWN